MGTQAFKQKPCTKPERDKGKTDHPAYMIRPLGIIPWTDAFAHKKGSCNVFPCVNKYHADKTMAKLQSCQGHFICHLLFQTREVRTAIGHTILRSVEEGRLRHK